MSTIFNEICSRDGESIFTCRHTYCEECGSTEDVCGFCLRCAGCAGSVDPCNSNFWIDDKTGERANCDTGERAPHDCPLLDANGRLIEEEDPAIEKGVEA